MTILRSPLASGLALSALLLSAGQAAAQAVSPEAPPGMAVLSPHDPLTPAQSVEALEKRTDVANAKLPVYPQAAREAKRPGGPPGPAGQKPPKPPPDQAAAPTTAPPAPH